MKISKLLSIILCFVVLVGSQKIDTVDSPTLPEPTETVTVTQELPALETTTKATTESIETVEPEYVFYDVPFDVDTQKYISDICSEYGLEYELILGIISVESTFKADTIGDGGNSFGLMQIQPKWWGEIMECEGVTDLLNPLENIRCGCAILQELKNRYGTEYRALQAYNTGNPDSNNGYAEKVYRHAGELVVLEV